MFYETLQRKTSNSLNLSANKEIGGQSRENVAFVGPCSNCAKTDKECTLEWLRSMQETILRRHQHSGAKKEGVKRPRVLIMLEKSRPKAPVVMLSTSSTVSDALSHKIPSLPSPDFNSYLLPPLNELDVLAAPFLSEDDTLAHTDFNGNDCWVREPEISPITDDVHLEDNILEDESPLHGGVEGAEASPEPSSVTEWTYSMSGAMTDVNSQPPKRGCNSNSNRRTTSFALQSPVVGRRWSSSNGSGQRPTVRRDFSYPFFSDPSPSCLQQRLATSENQSLLSNGLIKIYHDSLENALCCWLTERTCPYTIDILAPDTNLDSVPQKLMVEEWGSIWSNRICERVCRLDRNASAIRGRPLTQSEDRAASRALQLAIMSFATQWALTSRRSAAEFSTFRTTENDSAPTSTSGSDRQSGLANVRVWTQATPLRLHLLNLTV